MVEDTKFASLSLIPKIPKDISLKDHGLDPNLDKIFQIDPENPHHSAPESQEILPCESDAQPQSQRHMTKKIRDRFSMVCPSDSL